MRWMGVVATSGPAFVGWPHPDACWRVGRPRECCEHEIRGCWDDWWTADRCCDSAEEEAAVADDVCVSDDPQPRPSAAEPFLFLWDEKVGGSTFNRWLLESAAAEGLLENTHISDFGWPNIIGAPYFLKLFGPARRADLAIVAGNFDWRAAEGLSYVIE